MKKAIRHITTWTVNILFYLSMAALFWLFAQVCLVSSFRIPTDSMLPEIVAGDHVLVLKPVIGARVFNLSAGMRGEETKIYRLPGIRKVRRNDMLVFNFPHPKHWDKIEMNLMSYYIKRCVGLPGDSLVIENGFYRVKGLDAALGYLPDQRLVSRRAAESFEEGVFRSFPYDSVMDWNIKEFGPLYIPAKGDSLPMNRETFVLYRKLIEWEQQKTPAYRDSAVWLGQERIAGYRFGKNYYFMAGDRVADSQDSRYWGLLPEEYIVGKAWIVWKSTDPYTGKFRWDRFMKRIN